MKKHLTGEEISAYIDGEARYPRRVAAHIQSCYACSTLHSQYLQLSRHLAALPEPKISMGFDRRVTAALESDRQPRRPSYAARLLVPIAAAAVVAASFYLFPSIEDSSPSGDETIPAVTPTAAAPLERLRDDADDIVALLESMLIEEVDTEFILAGMMVGGPEPSQVATDDVLSVLRDLSPAETDELFSLLTEYARGGYAF